MVSGLFINLLEKVQYEYLEVIASLPNTHVCNVLVFNVRNSDISWEKK